MTSDKTSNIMAYGSWKSSIQKQYYCTWQYSFRKKSNNNRWQNEYTYNNVSVNDILQEMFFWSHRWPEKKHIFEYFQENKWKGTSSPLYHSRFEDYHGYKLVDPDMKFAQAMTSILTEMTRNLADSRIIPFDVVHYAEFVRSSIKGLKLERDFPSTSVGTYIILFHSLQNNIPFRYLFLNSQKM